MNTPILTPDQVFKIILWYTGHSQHIMNITSNTEYFYPPTDEDKNNPSLWKPEHWKWYLEAKPHILEDDNKILKELKKWLSVFWSEDYSGFYSNIPTTITDLKITSITPTEITLQITTHRPGLIIGKAGKDINELSEYLNRMMDKKVIIDLKESDLWKRIY